MFSLQEPRGAHLGISVKQEEAGPEFWATDAQLNNELLGVV